MQINSVRLDLNAVEDGILVPMDSKGAKIRVAKWHNKAHTAFLTETYKKHSKQISAGMIDDEKAEFLLAPQWVHILKDMIGYKDGNEDFKYSPQTIIDMARNPQYAEFFKKVELIAKDEMNYRFETIKALGEDLPNSSHGQ